MLATNNQLDVVNNVETKEEDTEDTDSQVHGWTHKEHQEASNGHNHHEAKEDGTAPSEISLGPHCVYVKTDDHTCCQRSSLENNHWVRLHARDANNLTYADCEHCKQDVVSWKFAVIAAA